MPLNIPTVQSAAPIARAGVIPAPIPSDRALPSRVALASAYDASGEAAGCMGSPSPRRAHLSVATQLVPCGARVQICTTTGRCVVAVRRDTGPFVGGRTFDLNIGVVNALGMSSVYAWGVRKVLWKPVGSNPRTIASSGVPGPRRG